MTPPAAAAADPHRTATRRGPAPRSPRRVSGPAARPKAGHAGPSRPRAVQAGAGAVALPRGLPSGAGLANGALRRLAALPDHRLLDRLLTGRTWIGFVACALIGIVFMQVSLLKINAGIGRSVERAATLERDNASLRADVSRMGSNERIQAEAEGLGMVIPAPGAVRFLGPHGERVGGDALTTLAAGTATGSAPAGQGAGAITPQTGTPASTTAGSSTPTAVTPSQTAAANTVPPAATGPTAASLSPSGTPSSGYSPPASGPAAVPPAAPAPAPQSSGASAGGATAQP